MPLPVHAQPYHVAAPPQRLRKTPTHVVRYRTPVQRLFLTKIVATIGPASEAPDTIVQLIDAGVRVFRINFSHGDFETHARVVENLRAASDEVGVPIAVMGDLSGPKIRVGETVEGGVELAPAMRVVFQRQPVVAGAGDELVFSTSYPQMIDEVRPGQQVLLDDGKVHLVCRERDADRLVCEVVVGGVITRHKGVNLPETHLSVPALTEKDERCVDFAVEHGFDLLALSFVRAGTHVRELKDRLRRLGARPEDPALQWGQVRDYLPVISKIEKPQALDDLEEIVDESDGVMVARGDLGVEMDLAEVPVIQKQIIDLCHQRGKPVIVATQMLESMIEQATPTRAEVSDIATAVFEGADAVMLSGETAVGRRPVEAADIMSRVAARAGAHLRTLPLDMKHMRLNVKEGEYGAATLARGVHFIARDVDAKLVIMWVHFDGGARYLARTRMWRPIIAFSCDPKALRQMSLLYGVTPTFMEEPASSDEFMGRADQVLLQRGWARKGDPVVYVLGSTMAQTSITDKVCIRRVGDPIEGSPLS
ncbi:MAG: pyruvate kinase [Planctomycetota bacterium]|jgi:pyruvate kinase